MGLALCKSIVEKHHGYIQAFGTENSGARFVIYLPEELPQDIRTLRTQTFS